MAKYPTSAGAGVVETDASKRRQSSKKSPAVRDRHTLERNFLQFLSLYGAEGLPLRELIHLATTRYTLEEDLQNHWLPDGERGSLNDLALGSRKAALAKRTFLKAFSEEPLHELEDFENRLVSWDLISVSDKDDTGGTKNQGWIVDGRRWRFTEGYPASGWSNADRLSFSQDLPNIFAEMPDPDTQPNAERLREQYYEHAHLALEYIRRMPQKSRTMSSVDRQRFILIALRVLTHHHQRGDNELLSAVNTLLVKGALDDTAWTADCNLLMFWAELKRIVFQGSSWTCSTIGSRLSVEDVIQRLDAYSCRGTQRTNGLVGYTLGELMDLVPSTNRRSIEFAKIWSQRAWTSRAPVEMSALCRVLAKLKSWDPPWEIQREYHLLYGYHLSRAGLLCQAERFLRSGLGLYPLGPSRLTVWNYLCELLSVYMKSARWHRAVCELLELSNELLIQINLRLTQSSQGLWHRAKRELSARLKAMRIMRGVSPTPSREIGSYIELIAQLKGIHISGGWPIPLRDFGDYDEFRLSVDCFLADYLIASGELRKSSDLLKSTIGGIYTMRDGFIRSMRLALEMRLLSVQSRLEDLHGGLDTAQMLFEEIWKPSDLVLGSVALPWIVQELLAFANELTGAGAIDSAKVVLGNLKSLDEEVLELLPGSLRMYLGRRWDAAELSFSTKHLNNDTNRVGEGWDSEDKISPVPIDITRYREQQDAATPARDSERIDWAPLPPAYEEFLLRERINRLEVLEATNAPAPKQTAEPSPWTASFTAGPKASSKQPPIPKSGTRSQGRLSQLKQRLSQFPSPPNSKLVSANPSATPVPKAPYLLTG